MSKHLAVEESFAQEETRKKNFERRDVTPQKQRDRDPWPQTGEPGCPEKMEFTLQIESETNSLDPEGWIQYLKDHSEQELFSVHIKKSLRKDITSEQSGGKVFKTSIDMPQSQDQSQRRTLAPLSHIAAPSSSTNISTAQIDTEAVAKSPLDEEEGITYTGTTFLEWPLQGERNQASQLPIGERSSVFLAAIFDAMSVQQDSKPWSLIPTASEDPKFSEVQVLINPTEFSELATSIEHTSGTQSNPAERLLSLSKGVLSYFIPEWLTPSLGSEALLLFWGAITEVLIVSYFFEPGE